MTNTQDFYDGFADTYRFIFMDWEATVQRHAAILGTFLEARGYAAPSTVLDCTCGIGTQAIALAVQGYQVVAKDLSPKSVEQAKEYATAFDFDYPITFGVADLLQQPSNPAKYDVVLAFDNPIAHFQTDEDLLTAFLTMASQVKSGGLIMTSLRDYDALAEEKPRQSHIRVTDDENGRRVMFQVWDWLDDSSGYDSEMFVITQNEDNWQTTSYKARFRAWQRADVSRILAAAGLSQIEWHMPEESDFYQPIVTVQK